MSKNDDVITPKPILKDKKNPATAGLTRSERIIPKKPGSGGDSKSE